MSQNRTHIHNKLEPEKEKLLNKQRHNRHSRSSVDLMRFVFFSEGFFTQSHLSQLQILFAFDFHLSPYRLQDSDGYVSLKIWSNSQFLFFRSQHLRVGRLFFNWDNQKIEISSCCDTLNSDRFAQLMSWKKGRVGCCASALWPSCVCHYHSQHRKVLDNVRHCCEAMKIMFFYLFYY